MMFRDESDVYP